VTISTICAQCGTPIESDRNRILAGNWHYCDRCRPKTEPETTACVKCGRTLNANGRRVCVRCLGFSVS